MEIDVNLAAGERNHSIMIYPLKRLGVTIAIICMINLPWTQLLRFLEKRTVKMSGSITTNYYKKCKICLSEEGGINLLEEGLAYNFNDAEAGKSAAIAIIDCHDVYPVEVQYEGSWKAYTRFGTRDIIAEELRDFYYSWRKTRKDSCVIQIIMRSVSNQLESDNDDVDGEDAIVVEEDVNVENVDVEDRQPTNDDEEDED